MKDWNPFSLSQWIAWLVATIMAGITGTVGLITYADGKFENKEQAQLKATFHDLQLQEINNKLDKIESKLDRLVEKSK
jgi:hypothetical protein